MVIVITLWSSCWLFEDALPQAEVPPQLGKHTQVQVLVEPCHARRPYRSLWDRRAIVIEHDTVQLCLVHVLAEIPVDSIAPDSQILPIPLPRRQKLREGMRIPANSGSMPAASWPVAAQLTAPEIPSRPHGTRHRCARRPDFLARTSQPRRCNDT